MALLASLFVITSAALSAFIPYLYKLIVDAVMVLDEGSYRPVWIAVFTYVAISLTADLCMRGSGFAGMHWANGIRATVREALNSYITLHSYRYFSNNFAGSLASKIKQAAESLSDLSEMYLWSFLGFFVSVVTGFTIVFLTSPVVGLILFGLFAIITPLNIVLARGRVPLSVANQAAETKLTGANIDLLTNINAVHEYARRKFELKHLRELILIRRERSLTNWRYGEWILLLNNVLQAFFIAAMMLVAVDLAIKGEITPGDIILFLAMVFLLRGQLTFIGSQFNHLAEKWGTIKESLTDITKDHEVADTQEASELMVSRGGVSFENVVFEYEGIPVFSDLTFDIPAGQRVGIIGRSGAGKSTLVKLILRHYDLNGGRIVIDGTDISSVTKESLREAIAIVPQEAALFHRSIHDNIAYGLTNATREEVIRAATQAQAHEFIERLPEGYESMVGERGIKLSGGQRQRIAIARALIKDAPILLLDEATSALDSESEGAVQKALLRLMEGRTVLAIAHRLSTLRAMDRLIIFDAGKIVEDGTHEELLKKKGLYADLWTHQAGGFLED